MCDKLIYNYLLNEILDTSLAIAIFKVTKLNSSIMPAELHIHTIS